VFLQIHSLCSYHATLLNRDDAGLAKRIPFGNATRLRVSSQCLKRHWRETLAGVLDLPGAVRTRHFFSREILPRLTDERGVPMETAEELVRQLARAIIKTSDGTKEPIDESLQMKQPVLFGRPEADYLVALLAECASQENATAALSDRLKTDKANFKTMLREAGHGDLYTGVEGALFGRFVTSDILARTDASVHVAHAFSVHAQDNEVDYFTVVDDLNREEETGAAHANDMDLGSGVYYGYVAVDIPQLISNFTGCERTAWRAQPSGEARSVLSELVRVIATTSPGAKLGATAPYAYADFVLLEAGRQQPRSLANAYLQAVPPRGDVVQTAIDRLRDHLDGQERMYGATAELRTLATTANWSGEPRPEPLASATETALAHVFGE